MSTDDAIAHVGVEREAKPQAHLWWRLSSDLSEKSARAQVELTIMHPAPKIHGAPGSEVVSKTCQSNASLLSLAHSRMLWPCACTVIANAKLMGPIPSMMAFIEASTPCASPTASGGTTWRMEQSLKRNLSQSAAKRSPEK